MHCAERNILGWPQDRTRVPSPREPRAYCASGFRLSVKKPTVPGEVSRTTVPNAVDLPTVTTTWGGMKFEGLTVGGIH